MFNIIQHDPIVEIRMERSPVNAMTDEFLDGLVAAHAEAVGTGARGVVISGREGLFSAGLDVPVLIEYDRGQMLAFWTRFFETMSYLAGSSVPIVAAITGHAPAGGAVLALHCDYRVAARGDFTMGLNEVAIGLPVPRNIFFALESVVGSRMAARMVTTGQLLTPDEALSVGLVDELAEGSDVITRAVSWLDDLLGLPADAMNRSRLTAKADLLNRLTDVPVYSQMATAAWFADETQRGLQELAQRLGGKK